MKKKKNYLLTILIPTSNRHRQIKTQLDYLKNMGVFNNEEIEILIADNSNNDESRNTIAPFIKEADNLNYHQHATFVHSAEENINRSIELCSGEYIWLLGDDDRLNPEAIEKVLNILKKGSKLNFYFGLVGRNLITSWNHFNSNKEDYFEKMLLSDKDLGELKEIEKNLKLTTYKDAVINYGLITTMCFVSSFIFKKSIFKKYDDYIKISPHYSHVFGFLRILKDEKIGLITIPSIARFHSELDDFDERLDSYTNKTGKIQRFPWTYGLMSLLNKAIEEKLLSYEEIILINELDFNNNFNLYQAIKQHFSIQIEMLPKQLYILLSNNRIYENLTEFSNSVKYKDQIFHSIFHTISQLTKENYKNKKYLIIISLLHTEKINIFYIIECIIWNSLYKLKKFILKYKKPQHRSPRFLETCNKYFKKRIYSRIKSGQSIDKIGFYKFLKINNKLNSVNRTRGSEWTESYG